MMVKWASEEPVKASKLIRATAQFSNDEKAALFQSKWDKNGRRLIKGLTKDFTVEEIAGLWDETVAELNDKYLDKLNNNSDALLSSGGGESSQGYIFLLF